MLTLIGFGLLYASVVVLGFGASMTERVKSEWVAFAYFVFCCLVSAACIGYGTTLIGK